MVAVQVAWLEGRHEVAASAYLTPLGEPHRAATRVSILSPEDSPWSVVHACTSAAPSKLSKPVLGGGRRKVDAAYNRQFWSEQNDW